MVVVESLVHAIPALELAGFLVRKRQSAALVLDRIYVNLYLVAYRQIGVVAELGSRNHTLALVADVNGNFALVDLGYGTLHHLARGDVRQSFVVSLGNRLFVLAAVKIQIVLKRIPVEVFVCYNLVFFHNCGNVLRCNRSLMVYNQLFAFRTHNRARKDSQI